MNHDARPGEPGAQFPLAGGVQTTPGRAAEIGASNLRLFTEARNTWRESKIDDETALAFAEAHAEHSVAVAGRRDS